MPPAPLTVGESIAAGVNAGLDVIGDNMPLVFGVAIAFVAWNVGKRVLGKI
jgi:phosphotransferase system  glucose/maltose/N-acetylglucosamine-specific IIC component